jgi:hypothetical protein
MSMSAQLRSRPPVTRRRRTVDQPARGTVKITRDRNPSILAAETMFQVARPVGATLKEV